MMISPSWMLNKGTNPPSAVNESCMELIAPQEAAVVMAANRAELKMRKRTSLPPTLPPAAATPSWWWIGFPAASAHQQTRAPARNNIIIADQTDQPCAWFLVIRPR